MEPMIKGYIIQFTGRYMLENHELRGRLPQAIVSRAERNATALKPATWYPRQDVVDLWRAIAAAHPDEASARAALVACGTNIGTFAAGTFLKLLFKVLTPRMFANKFPDLWIRDSQGGYIEMGAVEDNSLKFMFKDMAGFDHISPISQGWVGFALTSLGLKQLQASCSPWSLAEPGPREIQFEAHWQ